MASPFDNTPAVKSPSRYAALNMHGEQLTGLWTQANPYRDPAVSYLTSKFYGGSRIDRIIDGINREITQNLTDKRRPGSDVYNNLTFPAANSFYSWKYIQNHTEVVRMLQDGADGVIYDATVGQKSTLLTKSAGAGPARFLGVNTELFIGDGVDTKKVLRSSLVWLPNTKYAVGNFIIDSNGNIQSVQANPFSYTITATEILTSPIDGINYLIITLSTIAPDIPANQTGSFSGLTTYIFLNGKTLMWQGAPPAVIANFVLAANQIMFPTGQTARASASDTGTMVARVGDAGTSDATQPTWGTAWGAVTNDGGLNGGVDWTCFGSPTQNWGLTGVPAANPSYTGTQPIVSSAGITSHWEANNAFFPGEIFPSVDPYGNIQVAFIPLTGPVPINGATLPAWNITLGGNTISGNVTYINYGPVAAWYASTDYGGSGSGISNPCVTLDPNGNLQGVQDITTAGASGTTQPTWNATAGGTTTDGALTWVCLGPGSLLWSGVYQYSWSPHGIDGSVGTASPITLVASGGIGPAGSFHLHLDASLVGTAAMTDRQCDQIYLWRTAQGKPTLIFLDSIPNPFLLGNTHIDYQDVSTDLDLNAFIAAPVAESNDPPQSTMGAPVYHLQRVWGIVDNMVVYSGGPDTLVGNGNTAFPPLNEIPYPAQPIYLLPVTVQGGGILVFTTSGVYIILGTGTPSDPFYTTIYYPSVNLAGYNAIDVYNTAVFLMEANGKVSTLAIEYPFNPQSGYTEIGFPIGDQFKKVTTGGISAALYNPATAYVSWNIQSSAETSMFVSDGAVGWFNMQNINPPESGILWNPRAQIAGGTSAVQSIETSPGLHQLLIGPPVGTTGPILMRDATGTVFTDNGVPYPAWDIKGVMTLCSTGQWCEVAHVSTKSVAVGARPVVSTLMGEIRPTANHPWNVLKLNNKSNDPPETPKSESVFSDRYLLAENGVPCTGDCISVRFDYGSQDEADELLDFGIFAALMNEREEQVPAGQ